MSFAMPGRPQVLEWSLPVVYDCLREFYVALPLEVGRAWEAMTERHFTLWTALILDDYEHWRADLRRLAAEARSLRIGFPTCWAADRHVAAEIFNLGQRRFRLMPREARENNLALLGLLTQLQQEEAAYAGASSPLVPAA